MSGVIPGDGTATAAVDFDVAVIGFGPVGAVLAGLLGQRGLRVLVIEQELDIFPLPRAAHIDHHGLRVLQELGLLDELMPAMLTNPGVYCVNGEGRLLLRITAEGQSRSGLPTSLYFHQPHFDRALRAYVSSLPTVNVQLGRCLTGIEVSASEVVLAHEDFALAAPQAGPGGSESGGGLEYVRVSYAVGCDGANSTVRRLAGIQLDDFGFSEDWLVNDIVLKGPVPGLPDRAINICDPQRPHLIIPMPGNRYRMELMIGAGEGLTAREDASFAEDLIAAWIPRDSAAIERRAVYSFQGRVAKEWQQGRVLVAGDAAHLMPPFLGQGMCSGIRDAANLAWKLAAVVSGRAPAELLSTYGPERAPHVRAIVEAAISLGRIVCTTDPVEAATRDEALLADDPELLSRLAFSLPSLAAGPLVLDGGGDLFVQPVGEPGRRLDDVVGARFLVLCRDGIEPGPAASFWIETVRAHVASVSDLGDPTGEILGYLDQHRADIVVVRPDRYVLAAVNNLAPVTEAVRSLLRIGSDSDSDGYARARRSEKPAPALVMTAGLGDELDSQ